MQTEHLSGGVLSFNVPLEGAMVKKSVVTLLANNSVQVGFHRFPMSVPVEMGLIVRHKCTIFHWTFINCHSLGINLVNTHNVTFQIILL